MFFAFAYHLLLSYDRLLGIHPFSIIEDGILSNARRIQLLVHTPNRPAQRCCAHHYRSYHCSIARKLLLYNGYRGCLIFCNCNCYDIVDPSIQMECSSHISGFVHSLLRPSGQSMGTAHSCVGFAGRSAHPALAD